MIDTKINRKQKILTIHQSKKDEERIKPQKKKKEEKDWKKAAIIHQLLHTLFQMESQPS